MISVKVQFKLFNYENVHLQVCKFNSAGMKVCSAGLRAVHIAALHNTNVNRGVCWPLGITACSISWPFGLSLRI